MAWNFRKINWLGIAAGVVTLVALAFAFINPWWQLTIGEKLIKINASPVNTNFGLFGTQFTIPLIWTLNLIMILMFTASGVIMLIYSVMPEKPYARHLLGFAWKKPLYSVISFVAGLLIILLLAGHFGLYLPINGSATVNLPSSWTQGASVSALVSASFQTSFWIAIVAVALCVAARLYHEEIEEPFFINGKKQKTAPSTPPAAPAAPAPADSEEMIE